MWLHILLNVIREKNESIFLFGKKKWGENTTNIDQSTSENSLRSFIEIATHNNSWEFH